MNKVMLIGHLGKNPELRYTQSGQPVTSFSLATSETFKGKDGQKQTKTTWHNIVIWGKQGEIANQYLKKGQKVYLEGKIDNRSYDDRDGNKKYISEVNVFSMEFLESQKTDDTTQAPANDNGYQAPAPEDNDLPF